MQAKGQRKLLWNANVSQLGPLGLGKRNREGSVQNMRANKQTY